MPEVVLDVAPVPVIDAPRNRYTADSVLRTRPKSYRKAVQLLAQGDSVESISKSLRMSDHTIRAIRTREAQTIAERKQSLISIFANVAEISAERMEQLAGKAKLSEAGIAAGISTDKLMLLSGEPTQRIEVNITADNILSQLQQVASQIAQICTGTVPAQSVVDAEFTPLSASIPALGSALEMPSTGLGMSSTPVPDPT